jgi:hypothetical protein
MYNDLDSYKRRDIREKEFWKNLKACDIISDSEPPTEL